VLVGELDDDAGFEPQHPLLAELRRRHRGARIPRTAAVLEAAVPTILEQKVIGLQARHAYRRLLLELGEPAPGPVPLRLPPTPATLAATPYWLFHRWGVEQRRAQIIANAANHASRLEEAVGMAPADAQRRLTALPGMGAWTAAEIAVVALGDPDAVSVGDYHLPNLVSWALAGEPRGSDERMLELLEPYRGHRARAVQLLELAGIRAPRRGPRLALSRIRDF
jgi:3-methyladenine DNA glycosylase/8-oxoguanine DNA glycosylase